MKSAIQTTKYMRVEDLLRSNTLEKSLQEQAGPELLEQWEALNELAENSFKS